MLHEYRDIITHMKENEAANAHFLKIFNTHNELDDKIIKAAIVTGKQIGRAHV